MGSKISHNIQNRSQLKSISPFIYKYSQQKLLRIQICYRKRRIWKSLESRFQKKSKTLCLKRNVKGKNYRPKKRKEY